MNLHPYTTSASEPVLSLRWFCWTLPTEKAWNNLLLIPSNSALVVLVALFVWITSQSATMSQQPQNAAVSVDASSSSAKEDPNVQIEKRFKGRRTNVFAFSESHFPELHHSLIRSEKNHPKNFRKAIQRIHRDIRRIQATADKRPDKLDVMIDQWKLKTRVEIAIAQYSLEDTDQDLRDRLKPFIEQMITNRLEILELDQAYAEERLLNIEKARTRISTKREILLESQLNQFVKSADRIRVRQNGKKSQRGNQSQTNSATSNDGVSIISLSGQQSTTASANRSGEKERADTP